MSDAIRATLPPALNNKAITPGSCATPFVAQQIGMHHPNITALNSNISDATVSPHLQGTFAAVAALARIHEPTPVTQRRLPTRHA